MIMKWCKVQTNEYDLQAIMYQLFALIINCTIMMRTKSQFSRNVFAIHDKIWCNKHLRHTTMEKYDNNGKGWYIRYDDNNNMSYKCMLSITWTEMGQLNTTPYIFMTKVIKRTNSMLETPPQDKLYRRLQVFNACEHSCIMMIMGGRKNF